MIGHNGWATFEVNGRTHTKRARITPKQVYAYTRRYDRATGADLTARKPGRNVARLLSYQLEGAPLVHLIKCACGHTLASDACRAAHRNGGNMSATLNPFRY